MKALRILPIIYLLGVFSAGLLLNITQPAAMLESHMDLILSPPSLSHWMGTDSLGRDLFLKIIWGGYLTLSIGIASALLSFVMGIFIGSTAGLMGGVYDQLFLRLSELKMAIPSSLLVGVSTSLFMQVRSDQLQRLVLIISISLTSWMLIARVTRNLILREKQSPSIEATRALGASRIRIYFHHLLPSIAPTLIVVVGLQIPHFLLFEGFLSFIGLGVHPPQASWGLLMQEGWKTFAVFPHLLLAPSIFLFLGSLSIQILCEELRRRWLPATKGFFQGESGS